MKIDVSHIFLRADRKAGRPASGYMQAPRGPVLTDSSCAGTADRYEGYAGVTLCSRPSGSAGRSRRISLASPTMAAEIVERHPTLPGFVASCR
jgi:hypothetical protein